MENATRSLSLESQPGALRLLQTLFVCMGVLLLVPSRATLVSLLQPLPAALRVELTLAALTLAAFIQHDNAPAMGSPAMLRIESTLELSEYLRWDER